MIALRRLRFLAYRSVKAFFDDSCPHRAAAISYYVLFSLFPLVIFSAGILGLVLRDAQLQADIVNTIMDTIPLSQDEGRDDVTEALENVATSRSGAIGVVGLLALGWSGSAMFGVMRSSLNTVFGVETPRPIVLQKLLDLGFVLAFTPFLVASVVATSALRLARTTSEDVDVLSDITQALGPAWWLAATLLPILVSFVAFFFAYLLIPAKRSPAKYVIAGAIVAAVLFEAGNIGFSVYLENFSRYDLVFGSLGAVVAFLFWVYLSANFLLLGAEVVAELPAVMAGAYDRPGPGPKRSLQEKVRRFLRSLVMRPKEEATARGDEDPARRTGR